PTEWHCQTNDTKRTHMGPIGVTCWFRVSDTRDHPRGPDMAAKVAKQPTDRVTVRLPVAQIQQMQALVDAGMYRNTTDLIYNALKELLFSKGSQAKQTIEAQQGMLELQRKLAEIEAIKGKLGL